ncbi:abdominal-B [Tribolium castaneum]|uniref:Abdominal-B n=1 Tax=Tribolium castaneum TaxID=7070 RepID=A0A139WMJ8_TRICA|nr:abdominal-B [Tribolium castaneum]
MQESGTPFDNKTSAAGGQAFFLRNVESNASSCSATWKEFSIPSSCLADSRECFLGRVWQLFTKVYIVP